MHARFASAILSAALLIAALVGCAKADPAKFTRSDFTAAELAEFLPKKTGDRIAQKFEWPLRREHHVRLVLERSEDGGATWAIRNTVPYQQIPLVHVTLLMKFEPPPPVAKGAAGFGQAFLTFRLGGRGIGAKGWSESVLLLTFPGDRVDWTTPDPRPDSVLELKSEMTIYRVRLEAQEKPWAKTWTRPQ